MNAINTKKLTTNQKQELLKQLQNELRVDEFVQIKVNEMIQDLEREQQVYSQREYCIGVESEQATNYNNELLYRVAGQWRHFTMAQIDETFGYSDAEKEQFVTPYYRDITERREVAYDDLPEWERDHIDGLNVIITALKKLK